MSTLNRSQFKSLLKNVGVTIKGDKINKQEFRQIFGAKYKEPEWMLLLDYKFESPQDYLNFIEAEETKLGRVLLPSSYSITKFGNYTLSSGVQYALIGLVYQYSLCGNPRNVHYACRLFLGDRNISKNSGLPSLQEAKMECSKEAKELIENKLFDLT